eukprot:ANDGO_04683.mRNA.1 hypothetical protein
MASFAKHMLRVAAFFLVLIYIPRLVCAGCPAGLCPVSFLLRSNTCVHQGLRNLNGNVTFVIHKDHCIPFLSEPLVDVVPSNLVSACMETLLGPGGRCNGSIPHPNVPFLFVGIPCTYQLEPHTSAFDASLVVCVPADDSSYTMSVETDVDLPSNYGVIPLKFTFNTQLDDVADIVVIILIICLAILAASLVVSLCYRVCCKRWSYPRSSIANYFLMLDKQSPRISTVPKGMRNVMLSIRHSELRCTTVEDVLRVAYRHYSAYRLMLLIIADASIVIFLGSFALTLFRNPDSLQDRMLQIIPGVDSFMSQYFPGKGALNDDACIVYTGEDQDVDFRSTVYFHNASTFITVQNGTSVPMRSAVAGLGNCYFAPFEKSCMDPSKPAQQGGFGERIRLCKSWINESQTPLSQLNVDMFRSLPLLLLITAISSLLTLALAIYERFALLKNICVHTRVFTVNLLLFVVCTVVKFALGISSIATLVEVSHRKYCLPKPSVALPDGTMSFCQGSLHEGLPLFRISAPFITQVTILSVLYIVLLVSACFAWYCSIVVTAAKMEVGSELSFIERHVFVCFSTRMASRTNFRLTCIQQCRHILGIPEPVAVASRYDDIQLPLLASQQSGLSTATDEQRSEPVLSHPTAASAQGLYSPPHATTAGVYAVPYGQYTSRAGHHISEHGYSSDPPQY